MEAALGAMIAGAALTTAVSAGGRLDGGGKAIYAMAEADGIRDRALEALSKNRGRAVTVGMVADGVRLMDSTGVMGDDRIVAAQGVFGAVTINPLARDGSREGAFRIVLREVPGAACAKIAMAAADRYDGISIDGVGFGSGEGFDAKGAMAACSGTRELWLEVSRRSVETAAAARPVEEARPARAPIAEEEPARTFTSLPAISSFGAVAYTPAPAETRDADPYDEKTLAALAANPAALQAAIDMERDRLARVYRARLAVLGGTDDAATGRLLGAAAALGISAQGLSNAKGD